MRRVTAAVLACLVTATPGVSRATELTGGLYLPGQTQAEPDGALSLAVNPAGLVGPEGVDLRLQVASGGGRIGGLRNNGWGAYAAIPLGGAGLGVLLEHLEDRRQEPQGLFSTHRAALGFGLPLGERGSLGVASRWDTFGGYWRRTWDFGLLLRPWRWLSLGGRMTALGGSDSVVRDPSRWGAGLALRPLGTDALTLSGEVDAAFDEKIGGRALALTGRIAKGMWLIGEYRDARVRTTLTDDREQRLSLALRLSLGQSGFELAGRRDLGLNDEDANGVSVGVRLSSDSLPSLTTEGETAVTLTWKGGVAERPGEGGPVLARMLLDLQSVASSKRTHLLVLNVQDFGADWAQVEELRAAIQAVRRVGTRVIWYGDELGTKGLAVAAACDRIVMPPGGTMSARGVGTDFMGLNATLAKLGIAVQTVKYGEHKTAGDRLARTDPSPALAQQLQHMVERAWGDFTTAVHLGRDVTPGALEAALVDGAVFPEDAVRHKLIDAVAQPEALEDLLHKWQWLGPAEKLARWSPPKVRRTTWGAVPKIAILALEGAISDHEGGVSVLGRSIGGQAMAKTIDGLAKDDSVRAIVARIASPGGSVLGSDYMRDALQRAQKDKPVIASMAGVAASGGYWTSLGAGTVLADRATITGSIGIITVKLSFAELAEKLGLKFTHFGQGPWSEAMTLRRPWTEAETATMAKVLGRYYGQFLDLTSQRRKIPRETLLNLAEGRIWFGDEALQHGLVDRVGGLMDALAMARQQAGLQGREVDVRMLPQPSLSDQIRKALGLPVGATLDPAAEAGLQVLREAVGPWLDAALLAEVYRSSGPMAMSPVGAVRGP